MALHWLCDASPFIKSQWQDYEKPKQDYTNKKWRCDEMSGQKEIFVNKCQMPSSNHLMAPVCHYWDTYKIKSRMHFLCMHLCFIDANVCFSAYLKRSVDVLGETMWDSNKHSVREVVEKSDGLSACRRIGLQERTLLHPTMEGQLRVIGSLVLGGEFRLRNA